MALWLSNDFSRPSGHHHQDFSPVLDTEDLFSPLIPRELQSLLRCPSGYLRPWRSSASQQDIGSTVSFDKDKFEASLDVQQFRPEEITVKAADNVVTIEGKHEEKPDEHGYISRHFVRKYVLPEGHDIDKIESKLSSDGVLSITAPRIDAGKDEVRRIPIVRTGQPSKAMEQKKDEKEKKEE